MCSTTSIPPTIPFHVAQAYGVRPPAGPAARPGAAASPAATIGGPSAKLPSAAQKLVGATVPGRVDFSGERPAPTGGAIPMYRHPADRNAAATAVSVGRSLDVSG